LRFPVCNLSALSAVLRLVQVVFAGWESHLPAREVFMSLRCRRLVAAVLFALAGSAVAQGQEPQPASATPDLAARVRELETTVEALKAAQSRTSVDAAQQVLPSLPGADDPEGATPERGGSDGGGPGNPPRGGDGASQGGGRGINLERARLGESGGTSPTLGLPRGQVAGWANGFYVQSPDQQFIFRITGQIQADYKSFVNDHDTTDIDTFLIRRARLGMEAVLLDYYEFRLLPDFGQGKLTLQDAYMNVHYWDAFQFEVGKFKQPFSYEQLIQDRYVPTLERSLIDQLVPARDEGAMIHGEHLFDNVLDYGLAISNGEINGDIDQNNSKDFNARVAVQPFGWSSEKFLLHEFSLGLSGGFGSQNQPVQPAILTTPLGVKWFTFNPAVQAYGERSRLSPEVTYFYGPVGFAWQYFHMDQEMIASPVGPAVRHRIPFTASGYYLLATVLLTGETRTGYSQAIAPVRPFDLRHPIANPGAIELVGRVSLLHVGGDAFTPGPFQLANPANSAGEAIESTFGFNWYLNRQVRMQFNWEHAAFDRAVQLGSGNSGKLAHQDTLATRFQIIF
jgi:phosphate-selective porin OprO/OprP